MCKRATKPSARIHALENFTRAKQLSLTNRADPQTQRPETAKGPQLIDRAKAYGLPVRTVDGMDVLAVRDLAEEIVLPVRAGKGPVAVEANTYRYRGHSMADPAKYRTRAEASRVRETRDPIDTLRARLLETGRADADRLRAIDREVKEAVNAAAEAARGDAEPAVETLGRHVYAEATS